jgi:hypothetical protein
VKTKEGITAFTGYRGAGKSTMAALMDALGYALVSDDILAVSFNKECLPGSWPYLRRMKLKCAPITELALMPSESVSEALDKAKYFVPARHVADHRWRRLERIYLLEIDPTIADVSIDRLVGLEAVRVIIDQTYHFQFVPRSGRFREHLALCAGIAAKVPVFRLRRSPSLGLTSAFGHKIRDHLE